MQTGGELVVEAGTGTGKAYACLAPALRAGKKVIVSTGSKALQDQLYGRDYCRSAQFHWKNRPAERALQLSLPGAASAK
ncbi:hypothetical protein [Candidatus Pantoea persica]|uniref:hypothetical protein n=1 Tax=Candidatus Pantoea persica TaxID=2518128 RepID=UPI00403E0BED